MGIHPCNLKTNSIFPVTYTLCDLISFMFFLFSLKHKCMVFNMILPSILPFNICPLYYCLISTQTLDRELPFFPGFCHITDNLEEKLNPKELS